MPAHNPAEIHDAFAAAFNAGDMDALLKLYEPGAVLMINGEPISGREEICQALNSFLEIKGQMTLNTRLVVETGDGLALLNGKWLVEAGGVGSGVAMRGMSSEVVRRQQDGTWLFVIDNPFTPEP